MRVIFISLIIIFSTVLTYGKAVQSVAAVKDSVRADTLVIRHVVISGNRRTKPHIILRELDFREGDTVVRKELDEMIRRGENRLFNTKLFNKATIIPLESEGKLNVMIRTEERWYTFPIPYVEVGDRNFNEWWNERERDLGRLDFGIRFLQKNVRGRNENLKVKLQVGFNEKFEVFYTVPYINKNLKTGLTFGFHYSRNKSVAFRTAEHKLDYTEGDGYIRNRLFTELKLTRRAGFYGLHAVTAGYHRHEVDDTVVAANADYFLGGRSLQQYLNLRYSYTRDFRDIVFYPLQGNFLEFTAEQTGLGVFGDIALFSTSAEYANYWSLGKNFYLTAGIKGQLSFPSERAYFNSRALGYENDFVRGFELYVIDGRHFLLTKISLKKRLFNVGIPFLKVPQFSRIPLAAYLKLHVDTGYVNDPTDNPLNARFSDKYLWGGGIGIDFVTFYNLVLRTELSVNSAWELGFFINLKADL